MNRHLRTTTVRDSHPTPHPIRWMLPHCQTVIYEGIKKQTRAKSSRIRTVRAAVKLRSFDRGLDLDTDRSMCRSSASRLGQASGAHWVAGKSEEKSFRPQPRLKTRLLFVDSCCGDLFIISAPQVSTSATRTLGARHLGARRSGGEHERCTSRGTPVGTPVGTSRGVTG